MGNKNSAKRREQRRQAQSHITNQAHQSNAQQGTANNELANKVVAVPRGRGFQWFRSMSISDRIQAVVLLIAAVGVLINFVMLYQSAQSVRAGQRAYLLLESVKLEGEGGVIRSGQPFAVWLTIKNTGQTPAIDVRLYATLMFDSYEPIDQSGTPVIPRLTDREIKWKGLQDIGAGATVQMKVDFLRLVQRGPGGQIAAPIIRPVFSSEQIIDLLASRKYLFVDFNATYRDVFASRSTAMNETDSCYWWTSDGFAPCSIGSRLR